MDLVEKLKRMIIHLHSLSGVRSVVVSDHSGYLITSVDEEYPVESAAIVAEAGHLISRLATHSALGIPHYITIATQPLPLLVVDAEEYLLGFAIEDSALASEIVEEIKGYEVQPNTVQL